MPFEPIQNPVEVVKLLKSHIIALASDPGAKGAVLRMQLTVIDCLASMPAPEADILIATQRIDSFIPGVCGAEFLQPLYLEYACRLISYRHHLIFGGLFQTLDESQALQAQNAADSNELTARGYAIDEITHMILSTRGEFDEQPA